MSEVKRLFLQCRYCNGTGIIPGPDDSPPRDPGSCPYCEDGKITIGYINLTEIVDALDYIHGKVTAIWNQVKPGN